MKGRGSFDDGTLSVAKVGPIVPQAVWLPKLSLAVSC